MGAPHTMRTNRMTGLFVVLAMVLVHLPVSGGPHLLGRSRSGSPRGAHGGGKCLAGDAPRDVQADPGRAQGCSSRQSQGDKTTSPGCAGAKVVPKDGLNPVKVVTKKAASD